ncbi:GNAT family N-acetyltransferase [Cupriavidus basilensis]|uniref:GNAT family N-acetyltransferase n=1 Tax=Cupriavidus basilensis TaxID=68895 RepID=A0ABT6B349_9BURK|nr:GNAT family N-acetyltransferase [Cupriavidus basilensis]MDF3839223.1 GNAT family N-acetyltransferase [Cupriavidus basilensis]
MTRDLRVRAAQPADWPAIAEVLELCGLAGDDLDASLAMFHIALLDGKTVGCAGAESYGETIVVRSVAVLPPYRDRGIASHLVSALLMRARANGCRRAVLLSADCPNYFARYGFSLISAERLPEEVRASREFRRNEGALPLCMCCELR